nr:hypothetical protein [Tanacetum cinerariifolium]
MATVDWIILPIKVHYHPTVAYVQLRITVDDKQVTVNELEVYDSATVGIRSFGKTYVQTPALCELTTETVGSSDSENENIEDE